MSNNCPRCHAGSFVAGRIESDSAVRVVLADGTARPLEAFVCTNCGLTQLRAGRTEANSPAVHPDVQEYDF